MLRDDRHPRLIPVASDDAAADPLRVAASAAPAGSPADGADRLLVWLVAEALPRWADSGVDRADGGFFEKIDLQGRPVEEPRRARVVARQIYVFATAARRGWLVGADALVEHGLRFLFDTMFLADGTVAAAVRPDGSVVRAEFDLYEQAFVLFALAAAAHGRPDRTQLRGRAEALLQRMRAGWAHPHAGFEEAAPRTLPLKANPHMHLLEAALAWAEASSGAEAAVWEALADELVHLCLGRFIDADSGALHEFFDGDWRRRPNNEAGATGGEVEPGHQFEWAWLLWRWSRRRGGAGAGPTAAAAAARRLVGIGERHGVAARRGVAVDALDARLRVSDGAARLWPQTERIKAWQAGLEAAPDAAVADAARTARGHAIAGLERYLLEAPAAGLWHERMDADGSFKAQDCRASSLYHIVCAIETVHGGRR